MVQKVKVFTQRRDVPVSVEQRRNEWKPFGAAIGQDSGITYRSIEEVKIEKIEDTSKPLEIVPEVVVPTSTVGVCRRCGGGHWTLSCPLKDLQPMMTGGSSASGTSSSTPNTGNNGSSSPNPSSSGSSGTTSGNKYIPPSQRGNNTNDSSNNGKQETPLEELTQLRVSNLSDEVDENDLQSLFEPFGRIDKIHLAMDHATNRSRGFAFVRYTSHSHADAALKAIDSLPFKHLVLRVEWSRSDRQRNSGGGGGGNSGGGGHINAAHYSGYGKKLAQDVVRK